MYNNFVTHLTLQQFALKYKHEREQKQKRKPNENRENGKAQLAHTRTARTRFLAAISRCICHGHNPFLPPTPALPLPTPHLFNFTLSAHNEICV